MQFCSTKFEDAWLLKIEPHNDERGFFARTWCSDELRRQGLCDRLVQCSVSFNQYKGTLRGMHFQAKPCEEVKIVRCTRGAIFDVLVDCRINSPTFGQWEGFVLDEENRDALYIPAGFKDRDSVARKHYDGVCQRLGTRCIRQLYGVFENRASRDLVCLNSDGTRREIHADDFWV